MRAAADPMAVTDPAGRIRRVHGLLVPCANTNIPTLMTAEKIVDAILAGW
jgi:5-(hydroxymethyl)furfural/furfural oxidase